MTQWLGFGQSWVTVAKISLKIFKYHLIICSEEDVYAGTDYC